MKIGIRLDASTAIGTGHLKRMLAVAHALRTLGAAVVFLCRQLDLDIANMVDAHGFALRLLPPPTDGFAPDPAIPHSAWGRIDQLQDALETIAAAIACKVDTMVVDHYAFDARWHDAVITSVNAPLMVIDDLADRQLAGRWVVDHNFHPDHPGKYAGRIAPETILLAGPAFAMLGPAYASAPRHVPAPDVKSIGIFMGGVDLGQDSMRVLAALGEIGWTGPVEIVSTQANPQLAWLRDAVTQRANTILSTDLIDLATFFARHGLQIGAGGGAIWERCCIGPPTVCLVCAENQRLSVPFLDAAGVVAGYDVLADAAPRELTLGETIAQVLEDYDRRAAMHATATALVDGLGASRIAQTIMDR